MKVNEVLSEAWSDYIPKFVPSRELEAEKQRKKQQEYVYKQSARFGDAAYKELEKILTQQGIRINDPRTYNQSGVNLADFIKAFALNFFGSDYSTGNLVKYDINKLPVPAQLNPGSIKQYLNSANTVYRDVLKDQLSVQLRQNTEKQQQSQDAISKLAYGVFTKQIDPAKVPDSIKSQVDTILQNPPQEWKDELAAQQSAQQPQQPAGPKLAPGVTAVSTDPVILRYGKRDYYIADDGLWHEMNNRNPVDDAWQTFFDKQAELVEPQMQVIQTPATKRPTAVKPRATTTVSPQAAPKPQPAAPSPEQIRQRKQADAIKRIKSELKPRVKIRPGETLDQAMARAKAERK